MPIPKSLLVLLCLVSLSVTLFAQNSPKDILDDPNITWAVEAYTHYVPSASSLDIGLEQMKELYTTEERNSARFLKLLDDLSDDALYGEPKQLSTLMLNLEASKVSIYKTADLKKEYSKEEYEEAKTTVDTIITFDPETYEEIVQIVVFEFKEQDVKVFKVKQIIYYNSKTKQLGVLPVAIAPMLTLLDNRGKVNGHQPLFWLAVKDVQKRLNLKNRAYDYAIRMTRNIREQDMTLIKGKGSLGEMVTDMVEDGKKHPQNTKFYHTMGYMQAMTEEEVVNFGTSIDTIITFDPETFEEIVQVVSDKFEAKEVKSVRLVQDWAWDQKQQQLNIRLIAYAPICHLVDGRDKGHKRPYFYKKPKE
ncbi:MAG: hypothetical protein ACRBFS_24925 [Aureispira sp.]